METSRAGPAPPPPPPGRDAPHREAREGVVVQERVRTATPRMHRVLLHNDDYTSMEFVVAVLVRVFGRTVEEAERIMLQVHHGGVGVAGTYTRDEAETRAHRAMQEAREEGFPLRLTTEAA